MSLIDDMQQSIPHDGGQFHKFTLESYEHSNQVLTSGQCILKMDGKPLRGVQEFKVVIDAETMIPMVSLKLFAAKIDLDFDGKIDQVEDRALDVKAFEDL